MAMQNSNTALSIPPEIDALPDDLRQTWIDGATDRMRRLQNRQTITDHSAPGVINLSEVIDAVDKINANLCFARTQLWAIPEILKDLNDNEAAHAETLSYTATHFVGLIQDDIDSLVNLARNRDQEAKS